ncbi:hypothetical protein [Calycomorphotria hydatis]|uniref:Uncharacterized protein n=1 Tax=Calycomorphotria hydatis TaxID=2528027 RepID=A0A517TEQ9_9PLAN|nr:hypothetical protein [Calycomorphotria hydatis]QDT66857.1 hypothetical protein V22_41290 [Calycomorphotria hydatis]
MRRISWVLMLAATFAFSMAGLASAQQSGGSDGGGGPAPSAGGAGGSGPSAPSAGGSGGSSSGGSGPAAPSAPSSGDQGSSGPSAPSAGGNSSGNNDAGNRGQNNSGNPGSDAGSSSDNSGGNSGLSPRNNNDSQSGSDSSGNNNSNSGNNNSSNSNTDTSSDPLSRNRDGRDSSRNSSDQNSNESTRDRLNRFLNGNNNRGQRNSSNSDLGRQGNRDLRNWSDPAAQSAVDRVRGLRGDRRPGFDLNFWQSRRNRIQINNFAYLQGLGFGTGNFNVGVWYQPVRPERITGFLSYYNYSNPVYFRYGTNGNVRITNNRVYLLDRDPIPLAEYYNQSRTLIVDVTPDTNAEWQPLGNFALLANPDEEPTLFLQIALANNGVISGSLFNSETSEIFAVQGKVEEETQRVVWGFPEGKYKNLIMETGLFNLTRDKTDVLIHFNEQETENWLLVRMQEPQN